MRTKALGVAFFALFLAARVSSAQTLYGSMVGSVTDSAAAAIPNATVDATNTSTGFTQRRTTDERGAYQFNDLPPGPYDVRIAAPSFSTITQAGVQISINTIVRVDVQLQVGAVSENITVNSSASVLRPIAPTSTSRSVRARYRTCRYPACATSRRC
jgi:hypothetical protein